MKELNDNGKTEARTDNNGFKKLAVQWLNEHSCFVSCVVLADSLVLRNRQLLKPAKRYNQWLKTGHISKQQAVAHRNFGT